MSETPTPAARTPHEPLRLARERSRQLNGGQPSGEAVHVALHPELERRRTRTPFGEHLISHPLLVAPDREIDYAEHNETFLRRRDLFERAKARGDWAAAL